MDAPEPEDFTADHPFAYYVANEDSILFQGNVRDESALVR